MIRFDRYLPWMFGQEAIDEIDKEGAELETRRVHEHGADGPHHAVEEVGYDHAGLALSDALLLNLVDGGGGRGSSSRSCTRLVVRQRLDRFGRRRFALEYLAK